MPFVPSDLDKITAAIATGAKMVRFQDSTVEYNSLKDMLAARAVIITELGMNQSPAIIRQVRMITDRGL